MRLKKLGLFALLVGLEAAAASEVATIVRIEGEDVYVAAGSRQGLQPGEEMKAYRRVSANNPRDGKALEGLFVVGELLVAEVSAGMARLVGSRELVAQLSVGDGVAHEIEYVAPPAAAPERIPSPTPVSPAKPTPAPEPTAHEPVAQLAPAASCPPPEPTELPRLRDVWTAALSLPPRDRAEAWEEYLARHPESELAHPIRREVALLRQEVPAPKVPPRLKTRLVLAAPSKAWRGDPAEFVVTTVEGSVPSAVALHYRTAGSPTYKTLQLSSEGNQFHRGRLDGAALQGPALEYFVEAASPAGEVVVEGSAKKPLQLPVQVLEEAEPPSIHDRSRVRVYYEYVDFNRFKGNDRYNVVEGDFLYRLFGTLHSIRTGFGTFQGYGLSRSLLDTNTAPQPVGFHYGYTEFEFRLAESFALIGRGIAGVARDGLAGGLEGKVRIGREVGTSLVIGGAATAGIGQRANLALAWDAVPDFPMIAEVVVTNEPIGEDLGVRLIYTVGHSFTDWLDVSARVGYQLRDINHYGLSAGLGTTFHW